ncbi:flagellar basal-body rod protein FlgF [Spongiibacter taiwanensis]|uniref:flagellar basal-body rod protein FlgF n=1 Tax=Spongiibacter taiwanensis TaxID=1748242 RepID=UPI002034E199|nr:flagellar basal-body rod protein FlgF [Spongiibacter taiwanensis]USA43781.1 flagellar basal-body rod protein FlgF [Spongiibacter taiwanensis]
MDRLVFLGMTGAKHTQMAQTNNANNLANVSTAGFRADFQSLMTQNIDGPGHATRANAVMAGTETDFTPGAVMSTGRDLDVAIRGSGWFAVQAADGSEAYSRRGDFSLTSDGMLINGAGQPVMGDGGPVAIPDHQSLFIGDDGTVSIVPLGQGPESQVTVDRIRLVDADPAQLVKGEDGLIRLKDGGQAETSAAVRITAGSLESSNVNAVDAMVNMIALARQFEMQVKVMDTAKTIDETSARLMRLE